MDSIKYYNQGDALFICGSRRMRIKILCTQEELDSFGAGGGLQLIKKANVGFFILGIYDIIFQSGEV